MAEKLVSELERRMKALNLDAKTVSTRAGLGASFIRDIQRGKSKEPKRSALEQIARVLGCTVDDLLGGPPLPTDEEIERTLDDLAKESDTSAALVGGSLLEASLERLIRTRLLTSDDQLLTDIFGGRGPLSDLESKIMIAEALGLVTDNMASELHVLMNVRNAFVHSRVPVTFKTPDIESRVLGLRMIVSMSKVRPSPITESAKSLYLLAIRLLRIIFDQTARHGGRADIVISQALKPNAPED